MSIINDALKKVGLEKRNSINILQSPRKELLNSLHDISSRNTLNIPSYKPRRRIFGFKVALITLSAVGCILILLLFNVINHTKSNLKDRALSANFKDISFDNSFVMPENPVPLNNSEQFKLSGIFLDKNNESLAIINNEIVKEKGYINGAFVSNIQQDNVTLLLDNKEIVLVNK